MCDLAGVHLLPEALLRCCRSSGVIRIAPGRGRDWPAAHASYAGCLPSACPYRARARSARPECAAATDRLRRASGTPWGSLGLRPSHRASAGTDGELSDMTGSEPLRTNLA